ncbi:hypothetical protein G432_00600 [Sphingomonas sp. MM-1]|nr:hypothetical protein G432_00600 [Sphingomonas sp. MM-1]
MPRDFSEVWIVLTSEMIDHARNQGPKGSIGLAKKRVDWVSKIIATAVRRLYIDNATFSGAPAQCVSLLQNAINATVASERPQDS